MVADLFSKLSSLIGCDRGCSRHLSEGQPNLRIARENEAPQGADAKSLSGQGRCYSRTASHAT
jgi:hypothetical protein